MHASRPSSRSASANRNSDLTNSFGSAAAAAVASSSRPASAFGNPSRRAAAGAAPSGGALGPGGMARPGYTGPVDEQGRPHGHGTQRYQDHSRYEGEWDHGVIHGRGVYRYASGATYVGEFQDGLRANKGRYTFACGTVYEGDYANDKRSGFGSIAFSESAGSAVRSSRAVVAAASGEQGRNVLLEQTTVAKKYVGDFLNGKLCGKGTLEFVSGATFTGEFKDDLEHGPGTLVFNDGKSRLEGSFARGVPTGPAVLLHVESGERVRLLFDYRGAVQAQTCVATGAEGSTSGPHRDCVFVQGRCRKCGSAHRSTASDWLRLPPSTAALPPPPRTSPPVPGGGTTPLLSPPGSVTPNPNNDSTSTTGSRGILRSARAALRSESNHTSAVEASTADLERLATEVADILRNARAGLGMAIADCVRKGNVFVSAAAPTYSAADNTTPAAAVTPLPSHHHYHHSSVQQHEAEQSSMAVAPTATGHHLTLSNIDVRVTQIAPNSPASIAGIARGDYILRLDKHAIRRTTDFAAQLLEPGQKVELLYRRRHPMAPHPQPNVSSSQSVVETTTPERGIASSSAAAASSPVGEEVRATLVVGCTVTAQDQALLAEVRDAVAAALGGGFVATTQHFEEWSNAVRGVTIHPYPVAWTADSTTDQPDV